MSYSRKFFEASPLRSRMFVTAAILLLALLLVSAAFLIVNWKSLSLPMRVLVLVVACVRPVSSMWTALLRHKKLRESYFRGPTDSPAESHLALDVAASAILDDLFYTATSLLAVSTILAVLFHQR